MTNTNQPGVYNAIVQLSTGTVYGVGPTRAAAESDARRWADGRSLDGLALVPCTPRAMEYVREHGGAPSALLTVDRDGVCLREEE